jgi:hypothetical protein
VLALDVRHLELGIVSIVTATLAGLAVPRNCPASAPAMPAPSPEPVAMRETIVSSIACDDPSVQTVVFKGRFEHASGIETLHFQFAEMPRGYAVMMTGASGYFEVRVPREELGIVDLCTLPTSGNTAAFKDAQLSVEYALQFER